MKQRLKQEEIARRQEEERRDEQRLRKEIDELNRRQRWERDREEGRHNEPFEPEPVVIQPVKEESKVEPSLRIEPQKMDQRVPTPETTFFQQPQYQPQMAMPPPFAQQPIIYLAPIGYPPGYP